MLIISVGSWGARTVMLTYQEGGRLFPLTNPHFLSPSRPPFQGGSVVFHTLGKKITFATPQRRATDRIAYRKPLWRIDGYPTSTGFFHTPPPVPHRGEAPQRLTLSWIATHRIYTAKYNEYSQ